MGRADRHFVYGRKTDRRHPDRNGLRPARYYVTKDDHIIFSSEVGVIEVEQETILHKKRLEPGKMRSLT
ncbi:hypothetical protein QNN00_15870 [Bacillus velezensis]|nr:hypothetical protein [Bacillus velezensis]